MTNYSVIVPAVILGVLRMVVRRSEEGIIILSQ